MSFDVDDIDILEDFEDGLVTHYSILTEDDNTLCGLTPREPVVTEWKRVYPNAQLSV